MVGYYTRYHSENTILHHFPIILIQNAEIVIDNFCQISQIY
jgi:hypothetical protein